MIQSSVRKADYPKRGSESGLSATYRFKPFIGLPSVHERTAAIGSMHEAAKWPILETVAAGQLLLPEPAGRLSDAPHRLAERHLLSLDYEPPIRFLLRT
jgi:hypothetical protein